MSALSPKSTLQDEPQPTETPAFAAAKGDRDHPLPNSDSSTTSSSTCSSRGTDILLEGYKYLEVNNSIDVNATGSPSRSDVNSTPTTPTTADNSTSNHSWDMQDNSGRTINDDDDDDATPAIPSPDALTRLLSSCSMASESGAFASCCPICLDPMTPMDHEHPLQCPSRPHCHYNFCVSCINSLLSSSKDDFEMASDGNSHVKVYLHCPNCRADLSSSIRDVLLLRKVDTVLVLLQQQQQHHDTTNLLNASQERTRLAMQELHVQEAVQRARAKEKEFWKAHRSNDDDDCSATPTTLLRRTSSASTTATGRHRSSSSWKLNGDHLYEEGGGEDEWGVEADLVNGVHSSFRMPPDQKLSFLSSPKNKSSTHSNHHHHHHYDESKQSEPKSATATACGTGSRGNSQHNVIDETLFHGLEACMTHGEQLKVSHLHTTGKPKDLARAAHILQEVEQDARQGIKPSHRQQMMNRRASLYGIVEETRQIDISNSAPSSTSSLQAGKNNTPQAAQTSVQYVAQQQQHRLNLAAERRQLEMSLMLKASLLERCPLPVRMPKSITLDVSDPLSRFFPLRFCADTWDGTVLDAYTRLNISAASSHKWKITKKAQTQHPGVFHVLSLGKYQNHYGHVTMLENANTERILVASVQGLAGRQGVMKGDVVTHMDGDELKAGTTVEDLVEMIQAMKETGQKTFEMVLNADISIAEALKRRAQVMQ